MAILLLLIAAHTTHARLSQQELAVYDLVEEVGVNFYGFLAVPADASTAEIRKAYRTLSLDLHPDKSTDPDAVTKFQHLAAIADVLKDADSRRVYDLVLKHGLPTWRSPVYYYRSVARLSMWQIFVGMLVVMTVTQHAAAWAGYLERQYLRRHRPRSKKITEPSEIQEGPPTFRSLGLYRLASAVVTLPQTLRDRQAALKRQQSEAVALVASVEAHELQREEQRLKAKPVRSTFVMPVCSERASEPEDGKSAPHAWPASGGAAPIAPLVPLLVTGPWTAEEKSQLAKLCKRFPAGLAGRWEIIATCLHRTAADVTTAVKLVAGECKANCRCTSWLCCSQTTHVGKSSCSALVSGQEAPVEAIDKEEVAIVFTSEQQRQLEQALRDVPSSVPKRWDEIAARVEGKSKSECVARCKFLIAQAQIQRNKDLAA